MKRNTILIFILNSNQKRQSQFIADYFSDHTHPTDEELHKQ